MKADYQSYKRATSVSLLGLALQLLMGLTLLVYAFMAKPIDALAFTGAIFVLLGCVVWLLLAIVYDQHRRERIEQMELEAMNASGVRGASAFGEGTDDLRVAHKRLVWMHKFLVPAVSLLYAAALGGAGIWTFLRAKDFLWLPTKDAAKDGSMALQSGFQSTDSFGVVISLSLALAFVGFVFARYVAGMAKQPVWSHLRAGAGVAVGAAIFGVAVAIVQMIDKFGPNEPVQWMHLIWPVVMVVLAVEVVLSFLFGMYSPRKPGEFPRPALDSKILSFAAAPDRIAASIGDALNYQFGFDVTGNWFYQLLTRSATVLVLLGVVVVWLLSCIAIVQPNEQGLRVRLGKKIGGAMQPGASLKLPWPLETIDTFPTTAARRINLGGEEPKMQGNKAILWTNDHGIAETFFVVRLSDETTPGDANSPAPGLALATVEIPVYYSVEDYAKFDALGTADQRDEMLATAGRQEAFKLLATKTIDEVLGPGRGEITKVLRERVEQKFKNMDAGVRVLFVGVEGVHPPRETAAAFEDVVRSEQTRNSALENARKEANASLIGVAGSVETAKKIAVAIKDLGAMKDAKADGAAIAAKQLEVEDLLVRAGGTAAAAIQQARAERWGLHMARRGTAEEFTGQMAGYKVAPEAFIGRTYFETLATALKDARVYIVGAGDHVHMNMNLEDMNTGGSIFLKPKAKDE